MNCQVATYEYLVTSTSGNKGLTMIQCINDLQLILKQAEECIYKQRHEEKYRTSDIVDIEIMVAQCLTIIERLKNENN